MSEWQTVALGEVVEVLDSLRRPINAEGRSKRIGNVPYYGANGQQGWIDKPLFDEPLILLAEDGGNFDEFTERPIAYRIDGPAWVNNHAHIIRAARGTDQSFLFWSLVHRDIRRFISGGTRTKLTQAEMRSIQLEVPEYPEQRRIARLLDVVEAQTCSIQKVISKLELAMSGFSDDTFKESSCAEWDFSPLGSLLEHLIDYRGRTPRKLGMEWGGGEILALSANNVKMGGIDFSKEAYRGSESLYDRWMTQGSTRRGDILITLEAPLGNVAQVPDDDKYILSQRVVLLRFDESQVLNRFAYWYLRSRRFQQELVRHSTGTTASGIRRAGLEKIHVPTPGLPEQQKIADVLFAFESRIATERRGLAKLRLQQQGLMADLLTGRVRVPSPGEAA